MNIYSHRLTLWTQLDEAGIVEKLDELRHVTAQVEADKTHAVAQARKLKLSWQQIADELNVSKQAAWERWHHLDQLDSGDPDNDHASV
jgi:hypothetical protein